MRKHRVNLNLLPDRDPGGFAEDAAAFVAALSDAPDLINIFIAELADGDVLERLYGAAFPPGLRSAPPNGGKSVGISG